MGNGRLPLPGEWMEWAASLVSVRRYGLLHKAPLPDLDRVVDGSPKWVAGSPEWMRAFDSHVQRAAENARGTAVKLIGDLIRVYGFQLSRQDGRSPAWQERQLMALAAPFGLTVSRLEPVDLDRLQEIMPRGAFDVVRAEVNEGQPAWKVSTPQGGIRAVMARTDADHTELVAAGVYGVDIGGRFDYLNLYTSEAPRCVYSYAVRDQTFSGSGLQAF